MTVFEAFSTRVGLIHWTYSFKPKTQPRTPPYLPWHKNGLKGAWNVIKWLEMQKKNLFNLTPWVFNSSQWPQKWKNIFFLETTQNVMKWRETQKNFFWSFRHSRCSTCHNGLKTAQNVIKWREMQKKFFDQLVTLGVQLVTMAWKMKKYFFCWNQLRMSWNGEKCKKKFFWSTRPRGCSTRRENFFCSDSFEIRNINSWDHPEQLCLKGQTSNLSRSRSKCQITTFF